MKFYRGTKVYLTDVFMALVTLVVLMSIFIYSSLISKTDLRVLELEGKMKVLEKVLEKRWIEKLNEKPKKYKKVL